MNKGFINVWIAIGIIAIIIISGVYFLVYLENREAESITTFEECRDAGYPIMESYPEQCATPDGTVFVNTSQIVACPMDAKLCPDGSYVGREGPNCEFAECPRDEGAKLRVCPEAWYENRMPGPGSGPPYEQYFVIDGERVETHEVDIEWVENNCEVNSPQPVY